MDWMNLVQDLFKVVLLPLIGVLATYLINLIQNKTKELKEKTKNEKVNTYLDFLEKVVTSCVEATTQTYVKEMKDKNCFDEKAQKEAFNKTFNAVMSILSKEGQENLSIITSDLQEYIKQKIEQIIKEKKAE